MSLRAFPAFTLILAVATVGRADDPPAAPLPKGAKARLGSAHVVTRVAAVLGPDYTTALAADGRGNLRRYDLATGRPRDPGAGLPGPGQAVVSADGARMVNLGTGPLAVRNVATGELLVEVKTPAATTIGYTSGIPSVSMSADGKVLAQAGANYSGVRKGGIDVYVWDVEKNEERAKVTVLQNQIAAPVLSADGKLLATTGASAFVPRPIQPPGVVAAPGSEEDARVVQVWDAATGKELAKLKMSGLRPTAIVFSPDGTLLATACGDGQVELWEARTGKLRPALLGRSGQGQKVAFSPDGKTVAAVGADGSVQRWGTDGKPLGVTEFPVPFPNLYTVGVAFAGPERVVAWGTIGQVGVVWEAPSGKLLTPVGEHVMGIKSIAFPAGGKEVLTAGFDGRLVRWDAATGKPVGTVALRATRYPEAAFAFARPALTLAPDGTRGLAFGAGAGVYDLATGTELFGLPPDRTGRGQVGVFPSPDLTRAAAVWASNQPAKTGACVVWDLVARRKLHDLELPGPGQYGSAAAFSPDGSRLITATPATGPDNRRVAVVTGWDLKTGKKLAEFDDPGWNGVGHLAAADNGSAVLATTDGQLWGLDYAGGQKGELIDKRTGNGSAPVVFSPDGKRFVTGVYLEDGSGYGVRVYDWPRGRPLHTFAGHAATVGALAFSPDGKTLAAGGADTTVLLWDMTAVKGGE